MPTMINCPYCGKLTDPQLDSCVHCGGFLKKQTGPRPAKRSGPSSQTCPTCGALVREGDIICVACGTNLLTGQKIAEERKAAKKVASSELLPWLIAIPVAALIVVVGAVAIYYITQDAVTKAKRLSANGRNTEAISLLEGHVATNPDDANAHFELGRLYFSGANFVQAAPELEKAARLDPSNTKAARLAVIAHGQSPSPASLDAQLELLEGLARDNPSDGQVLYLLALARGAKQDYAGQLEALQRALTLQPTDPAIQRALAIARAMQEDVTGAKRELLTTGQSDADSQAASGVIAAMEGNGAAAVSALNAAVEANTSIQEQALVRLALLLIEQGKYGEALGRLDQALKVNGNNATAKYFRAVCLENQRLTPQAIAEFESIAESTGPYQSKAAVQAARLYLLQQNGDRALQSLGRVRTTPAGAELAEMETVRGRAYMLLGEVDNASDAFRKAGQADPNYAPTHLENGLLLVRRQDFAEGIRELERYLKLVDTEETDAGVAQVRALVDQLKRSVEAPRQAQSEERDTAVGGIS